MGHNPYFSRWFSAIKLQQRVEELEKSHNPYFSRWFSAIRLLTVDINILIGHNPYFSRWFSAIPIDKEHCLVLSQSQSLF